MLISIHSPPLAVVVPPHSGGFRLLQMATVLMPRVVSRETDRCCLEQAAAAVEVLRIGIAADRTEQLLRKRHAALNLAVLLNLLLEVAVVYHVLAVVHVRYPSLCLKIGIDAVRQAYVFRERVVRDSQLPSSPLAVVVKLKVYAVGKKIQSLSIL